MHYDMAALDDESVEDVLQRASLLAERTDERWRAYSGTCQFSDVDSLAAAAVQFADDEDTRSMLSKLAAHRAELTKANVQKPPAPEMHKYSAVGIDEGEEEEEMEDVQEERTEDEQIHPPRLVQSPCLQKCENKMDVLRRSVHDVDSLATAAAHLADSDGQAIHKSKARVVSEENTEDPKLGEPNTCQPAHSDLSQKCDEHDGEHPNGKAQSHLAPRPHLLETLVAACDSENGRVPARSELLQILGFDDISLVKMQRELTDAVMAEVHSGVALAMKDLQTQVKTWISNEIATARFSLEEAMREMATKNQNMLTEAEAKHMTSLALLEKASYMDGRLDMLVPAEIAVENSMFSRNICPSCQRLARLGLEGDHKEFGHKDVLQIACNLSEQVAMQQHDLEALKACSKMQTSSGEELAKMVLNFQGIDGSEVTWKSEVTGRSFQTRVLEQLEKVLSEVQELNVQLDCRPTRIDMSSALAIRDRHLNLLSGQVQDVLLVLGGSPEAAISEGSLVE